MTSANEVNLVSHPLVQHKLTLMREHDRSTKGFRELLNEIGTLLCYEVTSDLPHRDGPDIGGRRSRR